jgi:hypothetical protein
MIFAYLYYYGNVPSSSDAWNRLRTLCLTMGHIIFHTITSRLSSPGAFHNFTIKSYYSISSTIIAGISTSALYSQDPLSLILSSRGRKNVAINSLAYSLCLVVLVSSTLIIYSTFLNAVSSPCFRYLAAFYILLLSIRNSCQCFFFYY